MFCDGIKILIVVQLTYNYWVVGWNCVKVFADWLDRRRFKVLKCKKSVSFFIGPSTLPRYSLG